MSEEPKNTKITSNEEIIEEITSSLKDSLSTDEKSHKIEDFTIKPGSSVENTSKTDEEAYNPTTEKLPDDDEPDTTDESDVETSLQDEEVGLTDDQKAERKIIAEELKLVGNDYFKCGEYAQSESKYSDALRVCPLQFSELRAILYSNRGAARAKLDKQKLALKDCNKAIELRPSFIRAYMRRAHLYNAMDKLDESLADWNKIQELDPNDVVAANQIKSLKPRIEEKNEKLKTEMMGKLKDLGNMILRPFGLSTDNFKLEQDPESKGYKINFQQ